MSRFLALLLVVVFAVVCDAHIFFQCPPARSCFYGGKTPKTDGDGPWRMSPCDRDPVAPVVVVAAGETLCLTLQEFVPHPGYYGIKLVDKAVGPDDPEPVDWVVLMNKTAQTTDGTTTATQAFSVVIPLGMEAEHATIQVKQWAEDFSWYYYACTDIKVVATAAEVPANSDTCWDRAAEQCVVTDGPARMRTGILQMVVYGVWAIGLVAALFVWSIVVCKSSGGMARWATAEGDVESKESQSSSSKFRCTKDKVSQRRRSLAGISGVSFLLLIIAIASVEGLKSCSI